MESKIVELCCYSYSGECHWHNRQGFKCQFVCNQEECPHFKGNATYQEKLWDVRMQAEAAEVFPYETEKSCPNALARLIKNQYIDAARVGYIKGYSAGVRDAVPCA